MSKKVDNEVYLKYLLQSLNVNELKGICRDFQIKGYSRLTKQKLIEFILDSLAEEEIAELIKNKEIEIISGGIEQALKKISGEDRESISEIKVVNPQEHEVEIRFKGFNWEVLNFLSIRQDNIGNPDRDCDCRIGSNLGFCGHFWVSFIYSLKQGWFSLKDWKLTILPEDFEEKVKSIKLFATAIKEKGAGEVSVTSLINEDSDNVLFLKFLNKRVTIYDGEITEIVKRQSEFEGRITIYYHITINNARLGPQIKRKSDFREEDIVLIEKILLRISEKIYNENDLNIGDKISCNGGLTKDNFWGFMLKRVTKFTKKN
ncbi:MAG: Rho termination factor N-terminal domain-containing protein [Promethearchaeota archaeon]